MTVYYDVMDDTYQVRIDTNSKSLSEWSRFMVGRNQTSILDEIVNAIDNQNSNFQLGYKDYVIAQKFPDNAALEISTYLKQKKQAKSRKRTRSRK